MDRSGFGSAGSLAVGRVLRILSHGVCLGLSAFLLATCSVPGSVKPTIKIGLSAPFEGLHRDLGYDALHAVRLAVRERNAAGGVGQRYLVELVALNDLNEAEKAAEQARKMAVDPGVLGVLGGLSQETKRASSEYEQLGLTFLAPDVDMVEYHSTVSASSDFVAEFMLVSDGVTPGAAAVWAYSAANRLLDAMDIAACSGGHPKRSDVQSVIRSLN